MKTIRYFLLTISLLIPNIFLLNAQNTEGTEFWLTFGKLANVTYNQLGYIEMQIRIVGGEKATTGTIYFTNLGNGYSVNFEINPNGVFNHCLDITEKQAVYNTTTGTTNNSIFITTSNPVTVYAFTQMYQFAEATNILPITSLGTEYYQISFHASSSTTYPDAYAVVATQNNTHLFFDKSFITTLDAGQVYYRTNPPDMTGTHITSNNPVALIAHCTCTSIPLLGLSGNLMQQLAPVNTWDKTFFVPVSIFEKDIVRIVVSQTGTDIAQTGGTILTACGGQPLLTNLQPGEYVDLEISLINNGCFIEANKPVGVCSFMASTGYTVFESTPSQTWVPGKEQTVSKALIAPFIPCTSSRLLYHYALVITPTATKSSTTVSIGGAPPILLDSVTWFDNLAAGMSFYSVPLTNDTVSYFFSNPKGIIILGCGKGGDTPISGASYYYLAYSAMRDLDVAFYVNDIHFQDLLDTTFCANYVNFRAVIEGKGVDVDTIKWYIDGIEELTVQDEILWERLFAVGNYEIKMWVHFEDNDTISKTGMLVVKSCNQSAAFYANNVLHSELKDTTFCNKNVNFRAEIEGLHPTASDSIMWYINDVFETSQATWNKTFENGTYEIKLVVHYNNDTYATLTGTLKIQALWIKIKNVRY